MGTNARHARQRGPLLRHVAAGILAMLAASTSAAAPKARTQSVTTADTLPVARPDFPRPSDPKMLFFIQRSMNSNTVVYAATSAAGKLDCRQPLKVFWRRFNTTGERKPLNLLERTMAYGIKSRRTNRAGECEIRFVAVPDRTAILRRADDGRLELSMVMGGRTVTPVYAYVEVNESGLMQTVDRVRLYGLDKGSGEAVVETIEAPKH